MDAFWTHVGAAFAQTLQEVQSRGGAVRDALATRYPRLLSLLEAALDKAARETEVPGAAAGVAAAHRAVLLRGLLPFQDAFLSASVARMQQAVGTLYVPGARTPPSAVPQCIACAPLPPSAASPHGSLPSRTLHDTFAQPMVSKTVSHSLWWRQYLCSRRCVCPVSGLPFTCFCRIAQPRAVCRNGGPGS